MLSQTELENLVNIRRELHKHPETSGNESQTATLIASFLQNLSQCQIAKNIGGHGLLATFQGTAPGPAILVRVDMDALPIAEHNTHSYKSVNENVAHLCGHDGHVTIGLGLAALLDQEGVTFGRVSILFQPAEETGEGAYRVLNDPAFMEHTFDSAIALHNLPGFALHEVVVKDGPFACASQGLRIVLEGRTSHAAEPENGINPLDAIATILQFIKPLRSTGMDKPFRLATVVHVQLGEEAYGVSPGKGVLSLTLRAETDDLLDALRNNILQKAKEIAAEHAIKCSFETREAFAATVNEKGFSRQLSECSAHLNLSMSILEKPFRWSEDAGLLFKKFGGGLFGLGAGTDSPALHNPSYDFPDELIRTGITVFHQFISLQQQRYAKNLTH